MHKYTKCMHYHHGRMNSPRCWLYLVYLQVEVCLAYHLKLGVIQGFERYKSFTGSKWHLINQYRSGTASHRLLTEILKRIWLPMDLLHMRLRIIHWQINQQTNLQVVLDEVDQKVHDSFGSAVLDVLSDNHEVGSDQSLCGWLSTAALLTMELFVNC